MKILLDMNLSPQWVRFFSENAIEAVHWSSVGAASAPDSEILAFAQANGFVVFTHDLDFGMLLATSKGSAPSIVQVRTKDVLPAGIGDWSCAQASPQKVICRTVRSSRLTKPRRGFASCLSTELSFGPLTLPHY
jgi:predicted nuclease of predicted toxin-antitoxin system